MKGGILFWVFRPYLKFEGTAGRYHVMTESKEENEGMKEHENAKFERVGGVYWLMLFGAGIILPLFLTLLLCLSQGNLSMSVFLPLTLVIGVCVWIGLIMMIAWGNFSSLFVKRTAKGIKDMPYRFNSSFQGRGGILYIDVANGMIGFISAYIPFKIQIFNASRLSGMRTIASSVTGIRFVFYIDNKKVSMPTLLTNKAYSIKSGIGAEAVSKADTFVELLKAAKSQAERGM